MNPEGRRRMTGDSAGLGPPRSVLRRLAFGSPHLPFCHILFYPLWVAAEDGSVKARDTEATECTEATERKGGKSTGIGR